MTFAAIGSEPSAPTLFYKMSRVGSASVHLRCIAICLRPDRRLKKLTLIAAKINNGLNQFVQCGDQWLSTRS